MTHARAAAAAGDYAALLEELDAAFPLATAAEARDAAQKWLLGLWIARDADAAAAYVAERAKDSVLVRQFGLALASVAPGKVAAMLAGPLGMSPGGTFQATVLRALADADPREFLNLDAKPLGDAFTEHYARAMKSLAAADPMTASEIWLRRGTTAPGGKDALYSVVGLWVGRDPQAARCWADALTDPEARRLAQHAWLGALAKKDVAAARRELAGMDLGDWLPGRPGGMNEPALQYPQDARMIVLAALARENPGAAFAELENMVRRTAKDGGSNALLRSYESPPAILRQAIADAASDTLPVDPAALFAAFGKLTGSDGQPLDADLSAEIQRSLVQSRMAGWSGAELREALRQLAGLASSSADSIEQQLMSQATYKDPEGTVAWLSTLPAAERGRLAQTAIGSLDPENTPQFARAAALVPPEQWDARMGKLVARAPQEFTGLVAALPETASTGAARTAFAQEWSRQDPDTAAQWITALPPNAGATPSARGLAEGWAAYDDTAASTWAASLPPGQARDGAALGLTAAIAAAEPEAAWQWAASISDAALSAQAFQNVAGVWGREAPADFRTAFSAALDRSSLNAGDKARALHALESPRQLTQPPAP